MNPWLQYVGPSSLFRGQIQAPALWAQSLNHWTTRGSLSIFLVEYFFILLVYKSSSCYLSKNALSETCGSVIENLLATAGDMGSIPGPGRVHCCGVTRPVHHNCCARLQSPGAAVLLRNKRGPLGEKPAHPLLSTPLALHKKKKAA